MNKHMLSKRQEEEEDHTCGAKVEMLQHHRVFPRLREILRQYVSMRQQTLASYIAVCSSMLASSSSAPFSILQHASAYAPASSSSAPKPQLHRQHPQPFCPPPQTPPPPPPTPTPSLPFLSYIHSCHIV
jgi:hypothetical protein